MKQVEVTIRGQSYILGCPDGGEGSLLDGVNLAIHETGHLVFGPFGEFIGFAGGTNLAASHASGKTLLVLNPDARLEPGALEVLLEFLDRHPRASAEA